MIAEELRCALRHHPQAVAIITAAGPDGPIGVTVSSFCSASMHPPLVVAWIGTKASAWPVLSAAPLFAVHLLGTEQRGLADLFARSGADRFGPGTTWKPDDDGVPHLLDPPVRMRCRAVERIAVGDHVALVGAPVEITSGQEVPPLVRHQGRWTSVA
ncbi:flavin reductase family protein [Lentzea sp. NEAU-D7]|jgi:flavin reductase (DIM6/NTAB) family NADH-FMN oxidoreductase RutF|uniref:flavin reductase family protein n=1 Tax=Lentzea sp. NEAU-D7 TaxID=2994667 RepID=UPI00224B381F|nr:flavin reductase family protein [Lentzea sp. NEAU-D7]MCX2952795.1 flavin reductase family protein [Lentzea sp. NEAU-D7]